MSLAWSFCVVPSWQSFALYLQNCLSVFYLLYSGMTEVAATEVPEFDGRATSFAKCEEKAHLWKRASTMNPEKMAAHLLLHMPDVARRACQYVERT